MKKIFSMLLFGFLSLSVSSQTAVSVAGFFPLPEQVSREADGQFIILI